ncbi:MAG: histidine ammonia-lyase [Candidatus Marinimicrobia bacterium]|jgi:histidine ammonia-lyase|nr:histidine ammonia-lyase [Candidatus Neomarinimicrobiota bacterium]MDP6578193.1 histidine ammonia-lyase [Candidatus Neomarinimicrobiota bacterium]MDP7061005.1 histidine ammonia-lyase [Candidatus Neomarinimicrobiota bacterium]|tara:strand:- start:7311 stop:8831 length:1521 start_codon:yes stop_codon:yes gene_type:complete
MITVSGQEYTFEDLKPFVTGPQKVRVTREVKSSIQLSRRVLEDQIRSGKTIYGVNTGFGALSQKHIDEKDQMQLQLNLVRSHSAGVGKPFGPDVTRAILFLKLINFCQGYSGVRWDVVALLRDFINHDMLPVIPSKGSVGASGDLAPLSHMTLALIGEGEVLFNDRPISSSNAYKKTGLNPLILKAKEGLALLNGTQVSTALAVNGLIRMRNLLITADLVSAISVEATLSSRNMFNPILHRLKKHPGQIQSAKNVWNILNKSDIVKSHKNCDRVQDPYSFRCIPHVHGACRETFESVRRIIDNEINSVSDNPLVIPGSKSVFNSGHFHAEPVGQAADMLSISAVELGGISERRIYKMMEGENMGVQPFLAGSPGVESGYMMAQITAAALASENKTLAFPASVDSITTENGQEDFVSMAPIAGRKLLNIIDHLENILAIELLVATHLLDLRRPLKSSPVTKTIRDTVRHVIPFNSRDRVLSPEIAKAVELIQSEKIISAVNSMIKLN